MRYGYLVVEGPHDIEFVGRLLKTWGLQRIRGLSSLDPFWVRLVPRKFPVDEEDLLKRHPLPTFFASATHSVAVHGAMGDQRLAETIGESLISLPGHAGALTGIGVLLDADAGAPAERLRQVRGQLERSALLPWPDKAGAVAGQMPRCGIYVLPDNQEQGTLETLLLESAAISYPQLLSGATTYIDGVDLSMLRSADRADFCKPTGRTKATVACIASVLKPGKAVQTSIQDNRWLEAEALALPRIRSLLEFLRQLLELA